MTAIELLVAAVQAAGGEVYEVLIPEQCALVHLAGQTLHITAQVQP